MDTGNWYRIRVAGAPDTSWIAWFEDMVITTGDGSETVLSGYMVDQAALNGLLNRIYDLGLTLLSVEQETDLPSSDS